MISQRVSEPQVTLRDTVAFSGIGVHTGILTHVRVMPADAGCGIRFVSAGVTIPALSEFIVDTRRATMLGAGGVTISTVEHLLCALYGLGIENATIEVEGPEIPILDGSAANFVELFDRVGLRSLDAVRRSFLPGESLVVRDGDGVIVMIPGDELAVRIAVDHPAPIGSHVFATQVDAASFRVEIAGARTYCSLEDAEKMREMGLARGGSLDNALVFGPEGPLTPLRFAAEPARHKALDLLGDLALVGTRVNAEFVAFKSGHRLHAQLTRLLREQILAAQRRAAPLAS